MTMDSPIQKWPGLSLFLPVGSGSVYGSSKVIFWATSLQKCHDKSSKTWWGTTAEKVLILVRTYFVLTFMSVRSLRLDACFYKLCVGEWKAL